MPLDAEQTKELKDGLKMAKKRPMSFGICPAPKPEGTAMLMHKTKAPEMLGRKAKKEGDGTKMTFGTVTVKGKEVTFRLDGDFLPGLAKRARLFLRQTGQKYSVVILGSDGAVLEQEIDEEAAQEAQPEEDRQSFEGADPNAAKWARVREMMDPQVARAASTGSSGDPSKLRAAWAMALEKASGETPDYEAALKIAAKLSKVLSDAGVNAEGDAADDPDKLRWDNESGLVKPRLAAALKAGAGDISKMRAAWAMATEKAGGDPPDYATALKALGALNTLLNQAGAAGDTPDAVPEGTVKAATDAHEVLAQLQAKKEELRAAFAVQPHRADEGKGLVQAVTEAVKAKNAEQAGAAFEEVETFLQEVTPHIAAKEAYQAALSALEERTAALAAQLDAAPGIAELIGAAKASQSAAQGAAAQDDWVQAHSAMTPWGEVLEDADQALTAGRERKAALIAELGQITVPDGATTEETAAITGPVEAARAALDPDVPNDDSFATAEARRDEAKAKVTEITEAIAARAAARKAFDDAYKAVKTKLEAAADLDVAPYATAAIFTSLEAAVDSAKDLRTEAVAADASADPDVHTDVAAKLTAWAAKADDAETHRTTAAAQIKQALVTKYSTLKVHFENHAAVDGSEFAGDEKETEIVALIDEFKQGTTEIDAVIAGTDTAKHIQIRTLIDDLHRKYFTLKDLMQEARIRGYKKYLGQLGASKAHQDGIMALNDINADARKNVVDILVATGTELGYVEASRSFIADKKKEVAEAADRIKALRETVQQMDQDLQAPYKDLMDRKAQIEALQQDITENPAPVVEGDAPQPPDPRVAELAALKAEQEAKALPFNEKLAELRAKDQELKAQQRLHIDTLKLQRAAEKQKAVLDAISFGPLSPGAGRPIPEAQVTRITALFAENPAIAEETCARMADCVDPEALTKCAEEMAAQTKKRFAWADPDNGGKMKKLSPDAAEKLAKRTLMNAAHFGADYVTAAEDAYTRGVQFLPDPTLAGAGTFDILEANRAKLVAEKMLVEKGTGDAKKMTIDPADPGFTEALDMLMFSSRGLGNNTPMLSEHVQEFKTFLSDPDNLREAQAVLDSVTEAPASEDAKAMVAKSLGIDKDAVDENSVKLAILKAMATPIAQGQVGSCFATAPVRNLRKQDPLAVMKHYRDIATTGVLNPAVGRPVPAVTNLPANEDPLARSLEYSTATAAARLENSRERKRVTAALFNASDPDVANFAKLGPELDADDWSALQPKLTAKMAACFTHRYDPTVEASETSSDGSSNKGFYRLVDADTDEEITTQEKFIAFIKKNALAAADEAGLGDVAKGKVGDFVSDAKFATGVLKLMGKNPPWDPAFGGFGDQASDVLLGRGGSFHSTNLVSKDSSDSEGTRAIKVLAHIVHSLSGAEDMQVIATRGMHSFNAVPNNKSLTDLQGDILGNITTKLVDKGADIAGAAMSKDRAAYLYQKQISALLDRGYKDAEKDALRAVIDATPDTDMTPGDLQTYIDGKLATFAETYATRKAEEWKDKQTGTVAPDKLAEEKAKQLKAIKKSVKNAGAGMMVAELGAPEFVIADTNWGSGRDHTLFVIAPDPLTGEPKLWQKSVMDGSLSPKDPDWLEANWRVEQ